MAARHISAFSIRPQRLLQTQQWKYSPHSETRYWSIRNRSTNSTKANKSITRTHAKIDYRPQNEASKSERSKETALIGRVTRFCKDKQKRRPYLFQLCTSLAIWFSADVIAQQIGETEYDAAQTGRMLIIGGSASIPIYKWFSFISTRVQVRSGLPKIVNNVLTATIRTAITCCIVTPSMSAYFFSMQSVLSGNSVASTWEHLQQTFPQSLKWTFRYWPMVNIINFSLVPTQFMGVFQAFAGLVWQTYLAWLNRRMMDLEKAEPEGQCEDAEESSPMMSQAQLAMSIEF